MSSRPIPRSEMKERVLVVCLDLLARGCPPSEKRLRDAFPEVPFVSYLIGIRDELRAEGRLLWSPGQRLRTPDPVRSERSKARGLDLSDPECRAAMIKTLCRIRAQKIAAGEPIGHRSAEAIYRARQRIYRDPGV